jgi:hypothetical protein
MRICYMLHIFLSPFLLIISLLSVPSLVNSANTPIFHMTIVGHYSARDELARLCLLSC